MTGEAPPRKAPRRFRFSLRTLLLASLLAGGAMLLHSQWAPWAEWTFVPADANGPSYAEFSSDGTRILTVHGDRLIRLWDAWDFTEQVRLETSCQSARLSPDGRWIVAFPDKGPLSVWDADTGREQARLLTTLNFRTGAFAPDGSWLLTGSGRGAEGGMSTLGAHLWDLRTGEKVLSVAEKEHVADVCFSPCGGRFLTTTLPSMTTLPPTGQEGVGMVSGLVGVGGVERVWNAATGCEIAEHRVPDLTAFNRDFRSTFFPDGSRAATIDGSKLQVWDAANGKLLAEAKPCKCYCVNVSPDGRRLLTIGWSDGNHVAQLWDVSNLGGIAVLQPRYPDLCTGTFSPDGQRIILYNGASVWSAEDGTELWNLGSPLRGVTPASFDPQGRRIVSGDENGAIHIWTRRRPERWWGVACLPAFWVTMLVCGAFAWSFRRDRKTL